MTGRADVWVRRTTIGCVTLLASIAGTVSYLHMHMLVALHGQPGWVAALTPLSVDGMIVAASTTLLADSRSGSKGGVLPWALLIIGSVASLAANVAVAEPTLIGRVIAAWPSFALTASYELLTRQVRCGSTRVDDRAGGDRPQRRTMPAATRSSPPALRVVGLGQASNVGRTRADGAGDLQRQAWQWALANRDADGALPSGKAIAGAYGRQERWGRLVKSQGQAGALGPATAVLKSSSARRGGGGTMSLTITEKRMVLESGGVVIADARVRPDGRWQVSTWPEPVDRNQAITALTVAELLKRGLSAGHPLMRTLRAELA